MSSSSSVLKAAHPVAAIDVERIRADFPILNVKVNGKPLAYLDNAASSQMPQPVIDRFVRYQTAEHANIHRGVHYLSEVATAAYEAARVRIQRFINAREAREIVYTRGKRAQLFHQYFPVRLLAGQKSGYSLRFFVPFCWRRLVF